MKLLFFPYLVQNQAKRLLKYFNEKNIFLITLFSVILIGTFLRLRLYLYNPSLWSDEISLACNLITGNFREFFTPLEYTQAAPPFFMIISKFILNISGQQNNIIERDLVIRLFPFLCSVVSLPLFAYLAHKLFNNKYLTLVSTCIIAFNSLTIAYSTEFKQYSTEMLATIILYIAFYSINLKTDSYKKNIPLFFSFLPCPLVFFFIIFYFSRRIYSYIN